MFQSGKAGSFLSPNAFVVKDPEQEKKFSFCLQDSLGIASSQRLLQVLVTPSYHLFLCYLFSSRPVDCVFVAFPLSDGTRLVDDNDAVTNSESWFHPHILASESSSADFLPPSVALISAPL